MEQRKEFLEAAVRGDRGQRASPRRDRHNIVSACPRADVPERACARLVRECRPPRRWLAE